MIGVVPNDKIRGILKFFILKDKNISEDREKNCSVYGDDAVTRRVAQRWFKRFPLGNFNGKCIPRPGRPIMGKVDKIMEEGLGKKHVINREAAQEVNKHHVTVLDHLHSDRLVKKLDK